MTIGFSYVPEGACIISDRGGREKSDRLEKLGVAGVSRGKWSDDVAVAVEAGGEDGSDAPRDSALDAVEPCSWSR